MQTQIIISIVSPIVAGLVLAAVIGIFKILFEFRRWVCHLESFEKIVEEELKENRRVHIVMRKELSDHISTEIAIMRSIQARTEEKHV